MENLFIKGEKNTYFIPNVQLNAETGVCELSGESYLEDTFAFYQEIINWVREYCQTINKPITLNISLTYFNTASSRSLLDVFLVLKEYRDGGGEVQINWYMQEWDDDMQQEVEDFSADSGLEISVAQLSK